MTEDAVAAANTLAPALLGGSIDTNLLASVQRRRELLTRATQAMQVVIQNRIIQPSLEGQGPMVPAGARVHGGGGDAKVISMNALRAHVENGRIVLDGHVDLPDGMALEVDGLRVLADDGIPAEERQKILQAIDEGLNAARRGEHVDADEFIRDLLDEP